MKRTNDELFKYRDGRPICLEKKGKPNLSPLVLVSYFEEVLLGLKCAWADKSRKRKKEFFLKKEVTVDPQKKKRIEYR